MKIRNRTEVKNVLGLYPEESSSTLKMVFSSDLPLEEIKEQVVEELASEIRCKKKELMITHRVGENIDGLSKISRLRVYKVGDEEMFSYVLYPVKAIYNVKTTTKN